MMEMSWLESDEVGPKKLKTGEDQDIMDIELEIDNHEIGCEVNILAGRLVLILILTLKQG